MSNISIDTYAITSEIEYRTALAQQGWEIKKDETRETLVRELRQGVACIQEVVEFFDDVKDLDYGWREYCIQGDEVLIISLNLELQTYKSIKILYIKNSSPTNHQSSFYKPKCVRIFDRDAKMDGSETIALNERQDIEVMTTFGYDNFPTVQLPTKIKSRERLIEYIESVAGYSLFIPKEKTLQSWLEGANASIQKREQRYLSLQRMLAFEPGGQWTINEGASTTSYSRHPYTTGDNGGAGFGVREEVGLLSTHRWQRYAEFPLVRITTDFILPFSKRADLYFYYENSTNLIHLIPEFSVITVSLKDQIEYVDITLPRIIEMQTLGMLEETIESKTGSYILFSENEDSPHYSSAPLEIPLMLSVERLRDIMQTVNSYSIFAIKSLRELQALFEAKKRLVEEHNL